MNILFLAVSAGGGHVKAAEAIAESIETSYPGSTTCIIDVYKYISPILDKVVIGSYLRTLKNSPKLWGKIYELSEKGENVNDLSQSVHKLFNYKIRKLVEKFNPDVIVCTHPFPLQMACNLKSKDNFDIPIVNIITDYAAHSLWINKNVDAYIVAHEGMVFDLENRGVKKDIVYPFGIPISNKFLSLRDKNKTLSSYNLDNKMTLLIMGGSLGIGKIKKLFIRLLQSKRDFQIIIACGNNERLKVQLEKIYRKFNYPKKCLFFGFTNKINELMNISDVLITKPGGLTITEALIMKLPIVIISPIPGQEEKNATFLLNNGVGIMLEDVNDFEQCFQYIETPLRIKQMKEMSEYISKPNSTNNIAMFLEKLSKRHH